MVNQLARAFSSKFNYFMLARKREVKVSGFVGIGCNVDIILGKKASFILGKKVQIQKNSVIVVHDNAILKLGDHVFLAHGVTLVVNQIIEIGADTIIGEYVSIRDHDHNYKNMQGETICEKGLVSAPVQIGSNVWIGCKSTITKGVHVGNNAVVGANSVVTRDVPPNTLVVGAPARPVKNK